MCGIIGVYLKNITNQQLHQISKLIMQSGIRGIHATGISYFKNNKVNTLSEHKSSSMKWDNSEELSKKFVKPTGENRKIIFYKYHKKTLNFGTISIT